MKVLAWYVDLNVVKMSVGLKLTLFTLHPLLVGYETHN